MTLSVSIQPESRLERVVDRQIYPLSDRGSLSEARVSDGDSSLDDQNLTEQITGIVENDAFSMLNERDAGMRFKRDTSRTKRDCNLSAKRCKFLLNTMENYLRDFNKKVDVNTEFKSNLPDIMKCLHCKQLQQLSDKTSDNFVSLAKQEYLPEEYPDEGHSSIDSGIDIFNLPDDKNKVAEDDPKQAEGNRVGAKKDSKTASIVNTASEVPTNQSLKDRNTLKPDNYTDLNEDQKGHVHDIDINDNDLTTSVNDDRQSNNTISNDLHVIKPESSTSVSARSGINEENQIRVTSASSGVANSAVTPQFITTESSKSTTEYTAITADEAISRETTIAADSTGLTETNTRKLIDLTKEIAVNENVTSVPKEYNVIGINNTVHPSVHPSSEGHSENQSTIANETGWKKGAYSVTSANSSRENNKSIEPIAESTKLQQLNSSTWTVHPVCFFGSPNQPTVKQMSPGSFYPNLSGSFSSQSRAFPFQYPLQDFSAPSSTNTAQFLPKFGYAGNLTPTGQSSTITSNVPITKPFVSQPIAESEQPTVGTPYFCTYMSLPTFSFPPSFVPPQQFFNDIEEKEESSKEWSNSNTTTFITEYLSKPPSQQSQVCTENDRRCNDGNCISKTKWCDNVIDCWDSSDEVDCLCVNRLPLKYNCDGYIDCPHAEDEEDCFGCGDDTYSCKLRDADDNPICVPMSQRCDGIEQCPNRIDEEECSVLSQSYVVQNETLVIGYTSGYLHMNVHGKWYPVCATSDFSYDLALSACTAEFYPNPPPSFIEIYPEVEVVGVSKNVFRGPYVKGFFGKHTFEYNECSSAAIFVQCKQITKPENRIDQLSKNRFEKFNSHAKLVTSESERIHELYLNTLGLLNVNEIDDEQDDDNLVGIIGGHPSLARWPFVVAISKDGYIHCGGVIISESKILTAAHCVNKKDSLESETVHSYYEVIAGMHRFDSFSPFTQIRKARFIFVHPQYNEDFSQFDIAIIWLNQPLDLNRYVNVAYLPSNITMGSEWEFGPTPQSQCIVIGYGDLKENGTATDSLREVEVDIFESCPYYDWKHSDSLLCAEYAEGGRDSCEDDSGSPLICRNPNETSIWYVAGIVSHGFGCGRETPGIYMKVKYFMSWMDEVFRGSVIGTLIEPSSTCPGVTCTSQLGICIPVISRCDGETGCFSAEDEMNCQEDYAAKWRLANNTMVSMTNPTRNSMNNRWLQTNRERTQDPLLRYFVYKRVNDEDNKNVAENDTFVSRKSVVRTTFTCEKILQTIKLNKRCNGHLDCEDGTDEENCTCRDYLSNFQPTAICDGHLDCVDKTDENDCGICRDDEFYCSKSGRCVSMKKRCNEINDCPFKEDEMDCFALTDGEYVNVDDDNLTVLNTDGLLSQYYKETWKTICVPPDVLSNNSLVSSIGQNICEYLGFMSAQSVYTVPVNKTMLKTRSWKKDNATSHHEPSPSNVAENVTCTALRIRCRPVLSSSVDTHLIVDHRARNHTYLWPWLAAIFVDGHYRCSALLLEPDWLLSSSKCTEDIKLSVNYTAAVLGYSRTYLYVDGPHQQVSVVDEIRNVKTSDISLLHLKTAVNFTRYVKPLFLEKKIYPPAVNDLCVAVGTDDNHVTQSILLKSILQNCDKCYRCFTEGFDSKCSTQKKDESSSPWSGTVFCRGAAGWYPAAVFHENEGSCSFRKTRNLTSIDYIHAYLTQILEEKLHPTPEPECNGVRCNTGKCVPWFQVCDDVKDCRDGADENTDMCMNSTSMVERSIVNLECSKSQLRCKNGMCVPKSAFCDSKVDCSDGTDEPIICTCANYLELTSPERLCDGVRHCYDKSDESPERCNCTETSFKCNTESLTCFPLDFVCDDEKDCPNGEDEAECIKVNSTDNSFGTGEVIQRSYGVWHSRCFSESDNLETQAKIACQKIGYLNGTIDSENKAISSNPVVPYLDEFYVIRLNTETWTAMHYNKPLVTLAPPKETCHRLFVRCSQ
ncbi:serine protease nudel-like [Pseudomyrmex gracilis]|uniref:serine protease nudel-like n=1 Tax=Pseudomyrmex gracilis TaxID=219809 RepID=UPI000994BB8D|nr:serine protease nudel-like [Pseudomyrmex gracilis]